MHEVKQLRRRNSKTFAQGRNRKLIVRKSPLHYWDDGWHDIDTTIENGKAHKLPYRFALHERGIGFDYESRSGGRVRVNFALNSDAPPVVERNRAIYSLDDLDIVFVVRPTGVKSLRILKGPDAPREFVWNIEADALGKQKLGSELIGQDAKRRKLELNRREEVNRVIESWTGRVRHRDKATRVPFWSDDVEYPVVIDPTITENIGVTGDDGTENDYYDSWTATVVRLGMDSEPYGPYHVGLRFQSVAIGQGATINSATLRLNVTASGSSGYGAGTIYGYDVDDAAQWSAAIRPSVVTKTTATTALARPVSTGVKSFTVTAIVQEIVNRAGWASGNDLALPIITTEVSDYYQTVFEDYQAAGTDEAELEIDFTGAVTKSFPPIHRPLRVWRK